MNINLAIKRGSKILRSKYISNSQLDSEILLAKTINKDRNYILLNPTKIPADKLPEKTKCTPTNITIAVIS